MPMHAMRGGPIERPTQISTQEEDVKAPRAISPASAISITRQNILPSSNEVMCRITFLPEIEHARALDQAHRRGRRGMGGWRCKHLCESILRTVASFWRSDSDAPGAEFDVLTLTFLTAHMVPSISGMPEMHVILARQGERISALRREFELQHSQHIKTFAEVDCLVDCDLAAWCASIPVSHPKAAASEQTPFLRVSTGNGHQGCQQRLSCHSAKPSHLVHNGHDRHARSHRDVVGASAHDWA
jgi:hypothetical protein